MHSAESYVRRIRNVSKRAYAEVYLQWLRAGRSGQEPLRPNNLSYMAAQAVRLELYDLTAAHTLI